MVWKYDIEISLLFSKEFVLNTFVTRLFGTLEM